MPDNSNSTLNIWPYYSTQNVQMAARKPVKDLGKDQFLQILVTQLRNQDPMQPLQDKEFIAQMAQFSSLEQMMNMGKEMHSLRQSAGMAAGLIGKEISWMETTESGVINHKGTVEAIIWRDGVQYAKVDDAEIRVEDITSISEPTAGDGDESEVPASE